MFLKKIAIIVTVVGISVTFSACGTVTGLPAHGGGKRSLIEQELVSAAVRGALKQIDFAPLRGHTVFIELGMISDAGGGTLNGGKFSLGSLLTLGGLVSPITTEASTFESHAARSDVVTISNIANTSQTDAIGTEDSQVGTITNNSSISNGTNSLSSNTNGSEVNVSSGTSVNNGTTSGTTNIGGSTNTTNSTGNSSTSGTTNIGGSTNTNNGSSTTNGYSISGSVSTNGTTTNTNNSYPNVTSTSNGTTNIGGSINTNSETGSSTGSSTTDIGSSVNTNSETGSSTGSSTTNIGGSINTNSETGSSTGSSTTNIGGSTNTSTGNSANTINSNSNGSSSNNSNTNQNGSSSNNTSGNATTNQSGRTGSTNNSNTSGNSNANTNQHTINSSLVPTSTTTQEKGRQKEYNVTLTHKGLGDYQNLQVPVSDGNYLAKMLIHYLRLNRVNVTLNPQQADAVLTVMVDVFGILRTRTDWAVHNTEKVRAKTTMEVAAFDARGKMIMSPRQGSYESIYQENYIAWIGPIIRRQYHQKGRNLMVDFSDIN